MISVINDVSCSLNALNICNRKFSSLSLNNGQICRQSTQQASILHGGRAVFKSSQRALSNIKMRANKKTLMLMAARDETFIHASPAQLLTIIFHHFLRNPLSSAGIFLNERKRGRGAARLQTRRDEIFLLLHFFSLSCCLSTSLFLILGQ